MKNTISNEHLLVIVASLKVKESLLEWLSMRTELNHFSSFILEWHSAKPLYLKSIEPIAQEHCIMFQIHAPLGLLLANVNDLKRDFQGTSLHYWIVPLVEAGRLE